MHDAIHRSWHRGRRNLLGSPKVPPANPPAQQGKPLVRYRERTVEQGGVLDRDGRRIVVTGGVEQWRAGEKSHEAEQAAGGGEES